MLSDDVGTLGKTTKASVREAKRADSPSTGP